MSVSSLVLGTAQLAGGYGIAARHRASGSVAADDILRTAFELGVRDLDTAPGYGEAEARIGAFLAREGRPPRLSLCTKLPALPAGLSSGELTRLVGDALEASRRRLRSERIDTYLIHAGDDLGAYGEALVDVLLSEREAGRIGRAGISIYAPEEVPQLLSRPGLTAVQFPFNLFDRRMQTSGAVERLRHAGHLTFARSPLLQGLLTLPARGLPPGMADAGPWLGALEELLGEHGGADPASTALAYAASRSGADRIVLGVDSPEQLRAAHEALERPLPDGLGEAIERRFDDLPLRVIDPRRWGGPGS